MDGPPICLSFYETELSAVEKDFSRKKLMKILSWGVAAPLIALSAITLFFPGLLATTITIDNISKLFSLISASVFFASLNFSNKINEKDLSVRKVELEYFIKEFVDYKNLAEDKKKELNDECNILITKRKGLK